MPKTITKHSYLESLTADEAAECLPYKRGLGIWDSLWGTVDTPKEANWWDSLTDTQKEALNNGAQKESDWRDSL